eukprot:TRINITY_DN28320_c0_g1_i1.p1 TRINITY_DN28320_c0_g1~~TRINITY_DN28320_c0_g1_i1.p1  ORF type:complete len:138 (+),score=7.41 TRINITY_DN28320_c0_g1_i1:304-717(+)
MNNPKHGNRGHDNAQSMEFEPLTTSALKQVEFRHITYLLSIFMAVLLVHLVQIVIQIDNMWPLYICVSGSCWIPVSYKIAKTRPQFAQIVNYTRFLITFLITLSTLFFIPENPAPSWMFLMGISCALFLMLCLYSNF